MINLLTIYVIEYCMHTNDHIHAVLSEVNFDISAWHGGCGSIAVAIQDVFGGEFVGVTRDPDGNNPCHLAVEIDGTVYDGKGRTTLESLVCLEIFVPEEVRADDLSRHYWKENSVPPYLFFDDKVASARDKIQNTEPYQ